MLKKLLTRSAVLIVVVVLGLFMMRRVVLAKAVELVVGASTGFRLDLGGLGINPFTGRVRITDFRLKNPKHFKDESFIYMPELSVDLKTSDLIGNRVIHFESIVLDVAEVAVVRDSEGTTNLSRLTSLQSAEAPSKKEKARAEKSAPPFLIDELSLTLGKIRYVDFSGGGDEPKQRSFDVGVRDKIYKNITDSKFIITLIALQITYHSAIGNLGFDVSGLEKRFEGAVANARALAKEGTEYVMATKKVAEEAGKEIVGGAVSTAKDTLSKGTEAVDATGEKAKALVGESREAVGSAFKGLTNLAKSVTQD